MVYEFETLEKHRISFILPGTKAKDWIFHAVLFSAYFLVMCLNPSTQTWQVFLSSPESWQNGEQLEPSRHRHLSPGGQSPGQPWRPPKHWWYTELGVPALIYSVWVSCAHGLEVQWGRSNESWRSWWEKSYMISEKFLQNYFTGTPVLPPQQAFKWWGLQAFLSHRICLPSLASSWLVRIQPLLCVCSHFFHLPSPFPDLGPGTFPSPTPITAFPISKSNLSLSPSQ